MSEIWTAFEKGEYALGLAAFRALSSPTPAELRWAGACLTQEGQYPEAELRLRQAVAGGEHAASIHLATVYLQDGSVANALAALACLDPEALPQAEAALWYRERARAGWLSGEHRDQLFGLGAQAWQAAGSASERFQVAVAIFVGLLHGHFGEHERALAYLDFAAENGQARQQEYVALCRAESLIALSQFDEADQQLTSIQSSAVAPSRELKRGLLLRTQQNWSGARMALTQLLGHATTNPWIRFQIHLDLLVLDMIEGDDAQARRHLLRAKALINNAYDQLLFDHRAGQWLSRQNDLQGVAQLQRAAEGLEQAGHLTGAAAALMALAEALPEKRQEQVRRAATLAAQLGTPPSLLSEWPLTPQTHQYLLALPETTFERQMLLGEAPAPTLHLLTLGHADLVSPAGRVSFRLGRVTEILCYLRRQGSVTLKEIQRDLFPDAPPQRAKNYFHQVRVDVAARVPGIDIHFDPIQKRYRLQGRATLVWDVEELEKALQRGGWLQDAPSSVEFLPASESEWACKERERLSRWVTKVGLETMEDWFQSGQYEKCIYLAERLLPIDPLDEGLHSFLLNATYRVKGHLAARHLYRESAATFVREVGEIPDTLQRLAEQWQAVN